MNFKQFVILGLFALLPQIGIAQNAQDGITAPANLREKSVNAPVTQTSDGSFTYNVPFIVPEFHGLEPKLGLSYSSGNTSTGVASAVAGPGWSLVGSSVITRRSLGGGAPSYDNAVDYYQLDGEDLLACKTPPAGVTYSNPYPWVYAAERTAKRTNSSCSFGGTSAGNMTSLRDNHTRVKVSAGLVGTRYVNSFVVSDKSGRQYTYTSLGVVAGLTPSADDAVFNPLFARDYLLTEVRDTQPSANVVTYRYTVDDQAHGWAYTLSQVSYGGYNIDLKYIGRPDSEALATWGLGNGTSEIGRQLFKLSAVIVKDGASNVRGYNLNYAATPGTNRQQLVGVSLHGSNLTVSGNSINSATTMPGYSFTYAPDTLGFWWKYYDATAPAARFHTLNTTVDLDDDGKDEALFYGFSKTGSGGNFTLPKKYYVVDPTDRNVLTDATATTPSVTPVPATSSASGSSTYTSVSNLGIFTKFSRKIDGIYEPAGKFAVRYTNSGASAPSTYKLETVSLASGAVASTVTITSNSTNSGCFASAANGGFSPVVGNFDRDPSMEVVLANHVYDIGGADGMQLVDQTSWIGALSNYCATPNKDRIGMGQSFEWAVDLDGDGMDEIVNSRAFYRRSGAAFVQQAFVNSPLVDSSNPDNEVAFGDVNGDGLADFVRWNSAGLRTVQVGLGTGSNFKPLSHWIEPHANQANIPDRRDGPNTPRLMVADFNGDGLGDFLLHRGYDGASASGTVEQESLNGMLYISTGNGFVTPGIGLNSPLGAGDFDGDGLLDLILGSKSNRPTIGFNNASNRANVMKSASDPKGKVITITYGSDKNFADNLQPGAARVVTKVVENTGGGSPNSSTSYSYQGGRFNYDHRRSMGYAKVTATLPMLFNETDAPRIETTYFMTMSTAGLVKSQKLYSGPIASQVLESFSENTMVYGYQSDGLPYSAQLTSAVQGTRFGTILATKRSDFVNNEYGEQISVIDRGFVSSSSPYNDIAVEDDAEILITFAPNLTKYIVNRPSTKTVRSTTASTTIVNSKELYRYDGAASEATPPNQGNLTQILRWSGPAANTNRRIQSLTYDAFGNVTATLDAKTAAPNTTTSYTYDSRGIFKLSETNAKAQTSTTVWNTVCQKPATVTDANGLVTTFTYDVFCRETMRDFPSSQYVKTIYDDTGNTSTQSIRHESRSGSVVVGSTLKYDLSFFDGEGRTYRTTVTGVSSADADTITTQTAYDARGNVDWASNPLFGLTPTVATDDKTSFSYDALNRPLATTAADGAKTTTAYTFEAFAAYGSTSVNYPGIQTMDAHCYDDAATTSTVCGDYREYFDHANRKVRDMRVDYNQSDVTSSTLQGRRTNYRYDTLGQLIIITDPQNINWAYTYDYFGNRLTANDPGLGLWTMIYDVNNNLITQIDAKAQVITFAYDVLNRITKKTVKASASSTARTETNYTYDEARAGYYNIGKETTQSVVDYAATGTATTLQQRERDFHLNGNAQFERHIIDGLTYTIQNSFNNADTVSDQNLPYIPSSTNRSWVGQFVYDAAGRVSGMTNFIPSISYSIWGGVGQINYANGAHEDYTYNNNNHNAYQDAPAHNWLSDIVGYDGSGAVTYRASYTRSATGRISSVRTGLNLGSSTFGSYDYTYDYAGRLLSAVYPTTSAAGHATDQFLSYDPAGRIRSKGVTAPDASGIVPAAESYTYGGTGTNGLVVPAHAPRLVGTTAFTYDANGNMLTGLGGRVMAYDAENRPLSVNFAGKKTCYTYGVDGTRLKKAENLATTVSCTGLAATVPATVYFGPVEIRNFKVAGSEQILTYPHPNVRLTNGKLPDNASYLHKDALGSVRVITDGAGVKVESDSYKPFGEQSETLTAGLAVQETKGFIGERYDADAGLQYLNARYYDPVLGMFLQPDWWEVMKKGVGTNRYSYSFNDPVNKIDPSGNSVIGEFFEAIGRALRGSSDNVGRGVINSVEAARSRGVADAWKMEQQLVRSGADGTRKWSDAELGILRQGGIPDGYIGDHITSVAADVTKAADHRNIQFLTTAEHTARHSAHGGTRVPISEDRIIDRTLGGRLPDLATDGARSWPDRVAKAIDTVLDSRTFAIIDAFDPVSMADRALRAEGYRGIFESEEDYWLRYCGATGNCT